MLRRLKHKLITRMPGVDKVERFDYSIYKRTAVFIYAPFNVISIRRWAQWMQALLHNESVVYVYFYTDRLDREHENAHSRVRFGKPEYLAELGTWAENGVEILPGVEWAENDQYPRMRELITRRTRK